MNQEMQEKLKVEDEIQFSHVPLNEVPYVWSSQIDMIEKAMTKGQADWGTSDEMLERIYNRDSTLWVLHKGDDVIAVIVTSVRANDIMTKLFVDLLAGERIDEWNWDHQQILLKFADYVGATCIEASCRPGLAKLLKGKGWSQKAIIMELKNE